MSLALAFQKELQSASSVVIGSHINPDGDAIGSSLAVSWYLDQLGVPNEVLNNDVPPRNLQFLPGIDRIRQTPKEPNHDLGVMVDLDALKRLGANVEPTFSVCPRLIVVDHHVPHEAPGDLRIIDVNAPATALILTRLFLEIDADITPEMATCLLTGIVTDTGSFRFRNTTPESLSLSALLLERGGDINLVSEELFQKNSLGATRLYGHMLDTMRLECNDQIALGVLGEEDYENAQAMDEEAEEFVNELLFIDSVKIAGILRQPKPGKVRCSIRSRADIDVATVAREFGGGGRNNAAGCFFELPIEEAEAVLMARLKTILA